MMEIYLSNLDTLWSEMIDSGMTDSFENISQLSVLFFLKKLDSIQNIKESNATFWETEVIAPIFDELHRSCRWSEFKNYSSERLYRNMADKVYPFLHHDIAINNDTSYANYLKEIDFKFPDSIVFEKAIRTIDNIDLDNSDVAEMCYVHLLTKLTSTPSKAQYRTPEALVNLMVQLTRPNINDKICDPAVGTGSFLVAAAKNIWNNSQTELTNQDTQDYYSSDMFTGMDFDSNMINIAAMNLSLAKVMTPNLRTTDALSANNTHFNEFSLILCNPPFSTKTNINYVAESLQNGHVTSNTAVLFFRLLLRMLKSGGRCAAIVPDVILFGVHKANMAIKQELINNHRIEAIIPITDSSIEYLGNLSFSIVIFTKDVQEGTDSVWYYNLSSISQIPDLITRFNNKKAEVSRSRYDKSFIVSREEIIENNYMLIFDRYRKDISTTTYSTKSSLQDLEIAHNILRSSLFDLDNL